LFHLVVGKCWYMRIPNTNCSTDHLKEIWTIEGLVLMIEEKNTVQTSCHKNMCVQCGLIHRLPPYTMKEIKHDLLTSAIGSHCLFKRSWTATLIRSSQVSWVTGRVSRAAQTLFGSTSFRTKFRIWWATGLSTGKIPSTNPDPYFHPCPLKEPPRYKRWLNN